MRVIPSKNTLP